MSKVFAFMASGFEEVECLAPADVLIRAGIEVKLVSLENSLEVTGSHHMTIKADCLFKDADLSEADVLFLPGGMPGTRNLGAHEGLAQALKEAAASGKRIAAICAGPSVPGGLGLLNGKKATCYPGFEKELTGATCKGEGVVTDGNMTTARGLGYALDLGLELVKLLINEDKAREIKASIQYD